MDIQEILKKFDREQRREITFPGMRREEMPYLIRLIPEDYHEGIIIYSHLPDQNIEEIIRNEIDYFKTLGLNFEWKAYRHDQPQGLNIMLASMGFEVETPDSVMIFDLYESKLRIISPLVPGIRRLTTAKEIEQIMTVQDKVWEDDRAHISAFLGLLMEENPNMISVFAVYEGDLPVSTAWIMYHPGSQFAGLWGGTTLPDYRNRGYYSSLLNARIQEAKERGVRYVTVDASPMSCPILENFGFQCISHAWRCVWRVNKN